MEGPEKRRREWLLGRTAAKDAVRQWLRTHHGSEICPADIEIVSLPSGQPELASEFARRYGLRLRISIAHTGGAAIAAAVEESTCRGLGIDVEERAAAHDPQLILTAGETGLLDGLQESGRHEAMMRIWCAKEAVAKAIGGGQAGAARGLEACEVDCRTGTVTIATPNGVVPALTGNDRNYVFASAIV